MQERICLPLVAVSSHRAQALVKERCSCAGRSADGLSWRSKAKALRGRRTERMVLELLLRRCCSKIDMLFVFSPWITWFVSGARGVVRLFGEGTTKFHKLEPGIVFNSREANKLNSCKLVVNNNLHFQNSVECSVSQMALKTPVQPVQHQFCPTGPQTGPSRRLVL